MHRFSVVIASLLSVVLAATGPALAQSREPVKIGLSAAVSGGSAASGEAIKRGLQIAIEVHVLAGDRHIEQIPVAEHAALAGFGQHNEFMGEIAADGAGLSTHRNRL